MYIHITTIWYIVFDAIYWGQIGGTINIIKIIKITFLK